MSLVSLFRIPGVRYPDDTRHCFHCTTSDEDHCKVNRGYGLYIVDMCAVSLYHLLSPCYRKTDDNQWTPCLSSPVITSLCVQMYPWSPVGMVSIEPGVSIRTCSTPVLILVTTIAGFLIFYQLVSPSYLATICLSSHDNTTQNIFQKHFNGSVNSYLVKCAVELVR